MNKEEIKNFKAKRVNLSLKIREWVKKNKNAYNLVVEYNNLTDLLKKMGCDVSIQTEWLKLENWKNSGKYYYLRNDTQPVKTSKRDTHSYTLNLSWTELFQSSEPKPIKIIQEFLSKLGLNEIDKDITNNGLMVEHTIKYEYKGSDDAFDVLKNGSQFILDTFSESDYEKFNIAIYGKKKNCE